VDSRHHADAFQGAVLKINAREAARLNGKHHPLERVIPRDEARADALRISAQTGRPVFVTRGAHGILVAQADGGQVREVPGIQIHGETDSVGAGDTVVAALAAMLGAEKNLETAARLANLAASITVRKLHTTGNATPAELREVAPMVAYLPEAG
jgi:sugar/nucleoside kinase (ribokinase family)